MVRSGHQTPSDNWAQLNKQRDPYGHNDRARVSACRHCAGADSGARSTKYDPNTRTSILVRRKQSRASSGRQTTGSFSLNDVLSTIGTPVSCLKVSINA
jgi:hypothetical protein